MVFIFLLINSLYLKFYLFQNDFLYIKFNLLKILKNWKILFKIQLFNILIKIYKIKN